MPGLDLVRPACIQSNRCKSSARPIAGSAQPKTRVSVARSNLKEVGDKWMTDLVMDADKQMARRVAYRFRKGTIAASGRCPDSVRGMTFHRALILDTCFYPHHKVEEGLDKHFRAVFSAIPLMKGTVVILHGNAKLPGAFAEHYYTAVYDPDMTALRPVATYRKSLSEIPLKLKPPLSHHPPAPSDKPSNRWIIPITPIVPIIPIPDNCPIRAVA